MEPHYIKLNKEVDASLVEVGRLINRHTHYLDIYILSLPLSLSLSHTHTHTHVYASGKKKQVSKFI